MATEQLALILDRFATTPERTKTESVKRIVSPAGVWHLAADPVEAAVFRRRNPGTCVLTQDELATVKAGVAKLAPEKRQELLGDLILVKSVFADATVEQVRTDSGRKLTADGERRRARWETF